VTADFIFSGRAGTRRRGQAAGGRDRNLLFPTPRRRRLDVPNAFGHRLGTRLECLRPPAACRRGRKHQRFLRSLHEGAAESVTTITSSPVAVLMS
jgi:hypothetical protein